MTDTKAFSPPASHSPLTVLDIKNAADIDTARGVRRLAIKYALPDVEIRLLAMSEYLDPRGRPLPQGEITKRILGEKGGK